MFGQIKIVYNKDASISSKPVYNAICIQNELGEYETLLLTESDLERLRGRSKKNPEDHIALTWFARAILWVLKAASIL